MKLSELTVSHWQGFVYGASGAGKTVFALGSRTMRTFVFDVDIGAHSAAAYMLKNGLDTSLVDVEPANTMPKLYSAMARLKKKVAAREVDLVVVDTATALHRVCVRHVCEADNRETPEQRDWGAVHAMAEKITLTLKDMPVHVVYLGNETSRAPAEGEPEQWRPMFQGSWKDDYKTHLSFVARFVLAPDKQRPGQFRRALDFGPDANMQYKDRSSALARYEKPDIDALLAKMMGSVVPQGATAAAGAEGAGGERQQTL